MRQVNDAKFYQEFFSKVDKAIFIEKEEIWFWRGVGCGEVVAPVRYAGAI